MVRRIPVDTEREQHPPFDWRCEMIPDSLDRCTDLTALDLSVGVARVPYSDLPCFTLVSGMRVREQRYWKETDPHYSLRYTLGLDECWPEKKIRLYREFEQYGYDNYIEDPLMPYQLRTCYDGTGVELFFSTCYIHLYRTQDHWDELLRTATKNTANYALDCIISDISKADGASLKKLMCAIQIMTNQNDDEGGLLKIVTDKLSWILSKLKDDPMKAELGRQLVKMLCSDRRVLYRALELYDAKRFEFCLRNGLSHRDVALHPCVLLLCRSNFVQNILTYMNFGCFMIEELFRLNSSFRNEHISDVITSEVLPKFAKIEIYLDPRLRKYFWFSMAYWCFDQACEAAPSEAIQERRSDDGYVAVDKTRCTAEEWLNGARYFWRSILCPYLTRREFLEFCIVDVLNEERRYVRFCQQVYEEVLPEYPSPRSLQQHCRVAVRQQLLKKDQDLVRLIDRLELPASMKEYLKLKL